MSTAIRRNRYPAFVSSASLPSPSKLVAKVSGRSPSAWSHFVHKESRTFLRKNWQKSKVPKKMQHQTKDNTRGTVNHLCSFFVAAFLTTFPPTSRLPGAPASCHEPSSTWPCSGYHAPTLESPEHFPLHISHLPTKRFERCGLHKKHAKKMQKISCNRLDKLQTSHSR